MFNDQTMAVLRAKNCVLLIAALALLFQSFPFLYVAQVLLIILWSLALSYTNLKAPSPLLSNALAFVTTLALFLIFGMNEMINLSVAMLLLSLSLKILVSTKEKQFKRAVLVQQFLIVSIFLYQQSLFSSIVCLLLMVINFSNLLQLNSHYSANQSILMCLKTMLICIPIVGVLFVFVPKLPSLWHMPSPNSAKVGLSDSVDPFAIASLSKSTELAFRVLFKTPTTIEQPLYWRAIIHEDFDGKSWKINAFNSKQTGVLAHPSSEVKARYQVYAEPSNLPWLYALDYGLSNSYQVSVRAGGVLYRQNQVNQTFNYVARSLTLADAITDLDQKSAYDNLVLPNGFNPKARQLAKTIKKQVTSDAQFVEYLARYYQKNRFIYTLKPPKIVNKDSIDAFMFDTQRGFCGHYASASAFIFRAAGIPARVVSGYLGGEKSQTNEFYSVYQYDAHAWTEVWIAGAGWQRFDATSVVAPDRLYGSLSQIESISEEFYQNLEFGLVSLNQFPIIMSLRNFLTDLDYQWTSWVLGFNQKEQQHFIKTLLERFNLVHVLLGIITLVCLPIVVLFGYRWWQQRPTYLDDYSYLFQAILSQGDKIGISKTTSETPYQYFTRLSQHASVDDTHLMAFLTLYNQIRYQEKPLTKKQNKQIKYHSKRIYKKN